MIFKLFFDCSAGLLTCLLFAVPTANVNVNIITLDLLFPLFLTLFNCLIFAWLLIELFHIIFVIMSSLRVEIMKSLRSFILNASEFSPLLVFGLVMLKWDFLHNRIFIAFVGSGLLLPDLPIWLIQFGAAGQRYMANVTIHYTEINLYNKNSFY